MTEPQNPTRIEYLSDEVIAFVEAQMKHPDRTYLMPTGTALHEALEEATRHDNPSWGDACRIVEKVLVETASHFLELGRQEAVKVPEGDCTTADCEGRKHHRIEVEHGVWGDYCDGCAHTLTKPDPTASAQPDRPTGTIFDLDIFREKLEGRAKDERENVEPLSSDEAGEYIGKMLDALAAELKTLIDNCMKQYAVPEGHVAVYLPREVAEFVAKHWTGQMDGGGNVWETLEQTEVGKATRQALSNGEQK